MERKDKYSEDESFRKMIETSKIIAPENLKYRIMHQIETEKVFTSKESNKQVSTRKTTGNVLKDLTSIFGTMYAVLAVIIGVAYFLQGEEFLKSPQFWGTIILVGFIFSLFWLISRLDANMKEKRLKQLSQKNETQQ